MKFLYFFFNSLALRLNKLLNSNLHKSKLGQPVEITLKFLFGFFKIFFALFSIILFAQ